MLHACTYALIRMHECLYLHLLVRTYVPWYARLVCICMCTYVLSDGQMYGWARGHECFRTCTSIYMFHSVVSCMRACFCTNMRTRVRSCIHAFMRKGLPTFVHACMHMLIHKHRRIRALFAMKSHLRTHAHARTRTCTYARAHTQARAL